VVYTSDLKGAGTDASVFCRILGRTKDGQSASTAILQLSSSKNDFERNSKDTFVVQGTELAYMDTLEIGHDGAGAFADWHLQHVEITNPAGAPDGGLLLRFVICL
jgi:lipoxygenase homology domain-containing protein 1